LGEAEALSECSVTGILITSPVVGASAVQRLALLAARAPDLTAVADHPDAVDALERAGAGLTLLVDIDPGIHRTGVASADAAVALARRISNSSGLTYGGVQFYCGAQQHITLPARAPPPADGSGDGGRVRTIRNEICKFELADGASEG
jgi:D-serine deaminase-like pyridoxal phosphate-dependent protein